MVMIKTKREIEAEKSMGENNCKKALITGITGQDGSYLTEFLLSKGYEVHGIIRRSSNFNTQRLDHIYIDPHNSSTRMKLHYGDLFDASALRKWVDAICPDEVYNLGAQSHVGVSFENLDYTADVVATSALRLLEAVRTHIETTGRQVNGLTFYSSLTWLCCMYMCMCIYVDRCLYVFAYMYTVYMYICGSDWVNFYISCVCGQANPYFMHYLLRLCVCVCVWICVCILYTCVIAHMNANLRMLRMCVVCLGMC